MLDVMFYEVFREERKALKRCLPHKIRAGFTDKTVQVHSRSRVPPARLISIRTQSVVPTQWSNQLSGILTRSTGFDHLIRFQKQSRRKVRCGYLPLYCGRAVAEEVMLMIFALMRKLKDQLRQFHTFNRHGLTGIECLGKELLVVGVGRIGSEIVRLGRALGMKVMGVDIVKRARSLQYISLRQGIRKAGVIVCALPLTETTRALLNYKLLRDTKRGAIFVNIARGEISPIRDLNRLLREGILGGVALDVYENEEVFADSLRMNRKLTADQKLILKTAGMPNVIFTPHNAFNTREALERKVKQSTESISQFLRRGRFPRPVK